MSQTAPPDSGLVCLVMLAQLHEIAVDAKQIEHDYRQEQDLTDVELCRIAKHIGFKSRISRIKTSRLQHLPLPLIAKDLTGQFFIIAQVTSTEALIYHPLVGKNQQVGLELLEQN